MSFVKLKRIRSPNFTEKEKRLLLKLIYERRVILDNRDLSAAVLHQKKQAWFEVTALFNKLRPAGTIRSVNSIRGLYDNLKNRVRRRDKIRQNGASNSCFNSDTTATETEFEDKSFLNSESTSVLSDHSDISRGVDNDFSTIGDEEVDTKVIFVADNNGMNRSINVKEDDLSIDMNSFSNGQNLNLVEDIDGDHSQINPNLEVENYKRQRSPNFSEEEKRFLIKLFAVHREIIDHKEITTLMNHKKDLVWQKIADQLNAHCKGGPFRSPLSIRRLYDNCKRRNRRKATGKDKIVAKNKITTFDMMQTDFVWINDGSSECDSFTCDKTYNEEPDHENNEVSLTQEKLDIDEASVTDSGICNLRIAEWAKIASDNPQWTQSSFPHQQVSFVNVESLSVQDIAPVIQESKSDMSSINNTDNIPTPSTQESLPNQRLRNRRRRLRHLSKKPADKLQDAKLHLIRLRIASERRKAKDDMLRRKALELDIALKELYLEKLRNMSNVKDVPFPPPCLLPK